MDNEARQIADQLELLKVSFKRVVVAKSQEFLVEMDALSVKGREIDPEYDWNLESDWIRSVLDEYFQEAQADIEAQKAAIVKTRQLGMTKTHAHQMGLDIDE